VLDEEADSTEHEGDEWDEHHKPLPRSFPALVTRPFDLPPHVLLTGSVGVGFDLLSFEPSHLLLECSEHARREFSGAVIGVLGRELGEWIDVASSIPLWSCSGGRLVRAWPEMVLDRFEPVVHHVHLQAHPSSEVQSRVVSPENNLAIVQTRDVLLPWSDEFGWAIGIARTRWTGRRSVGHLETPEFLDTGDQAIRAPPGIVLSAALLATGNTNGAAAFPTMKIE
jgi:hypothetical protein